jgi:hypothetical protein
VNPVVIEALQVERANALRLVEACDLALAAFGVLSGPMSAHAKPPKRAKAPKAKAQSTKPKAQSLTAAATRSGGPATTKTGRYREVILAFLPKQDARCADSAVIRREVAKVCKVDVDTESTFSADVSNALQGLKREGKLERSGTVWALPVAG